MPKARASTKRPVEDAASSAALASTPAMPERSLDPADWDEFRRLAHATLDTAIDFVATARDRPVWQPIPDHVKAAFSDASLPRAPASPEDLVGEISRTVLPYACGNTHPRFFGWVHGTGTAGGILAEMMAAAVNANLGGRDHAAIYVERQVIDWCRRMFGLPDGAGGLLVSGTSMATLIALTIARNHAAANLPDGHRADIRKDGLQALPARLVAYTSAEAHGSVVKALELIGVGREWVRAVSVDADFAMDAAALDRAIAADTTAGHIPFAVIATAGTVNTGAIDPLASIADVCAARNLWLHVDGAFGGLAVLSESMKPRLAGIERADSIAFDFHKWLHVPYDAGCVLVRRAGLQLETFSQRPAYLAGTERGLAAGDPWFCEMGPELSRGFRALKVWFTLKEHGLDRLGEKIDDNCRQARHLEQLIEGLEHFEVAAPVSLNIVCFRFAHPTLSPAEQDRINGDIVVELQERGIAAPSTTRLGGRLAIRVNITNHRTTLDDIGILMDAVRELAADRLMEHAGRRAPPALIPLAIDDDRRYRRLTAILARPEIAPVADGIEIVLATGLSGPFRLENPRLVHVAATLLDAPDGAPTILRHALELARWVNVAADKAREPAWIAAVSLLSARCAALYLAALPEAERRAALATMSPDLAALYTRLGAAREWTDLRELLMPGAGALALLMPLLRGADAHVHAVTTAGAIKAEAANLVLQLAPLAMPAEVLLTQGGDSRVAPDPVTGCNAYGTATIPQPAEISFSSSTASSVSAGAYGEVEALRSRLISEACAGRLDAEFRRRMSSIRRDVARITGTAKLADSAVILTASGTDTELIALDFARAGNFATGSHGPLLNIVIDPNETGSGVPLAAAGLHYLASTSQGSSVAPNTPIEGLGSDGVTVRTVALRMADGSPRSLPDLDREVAAMAADAVKSGANCLVHVLDASKTGLGAPSIELASWLLEKWPDRVGIVVDACQMRLGRDAIGAYLARGFMVQVTASKFYTAPPFAGALLVPPAIARNRNAPLAKGLAAYIGAAEWPSRLERRMRLGAGRPNFGLLARWTAGLHEIRAFEQVPDADARAILDRFRRDVVAMIAKRRDLRAVTPASFDRWDLTPTDSFADIATILPFEVLRRRPHSKMEPLPFDDLRRVYRLLTQDLSARLPKGVRFDAKTASTSCHLGQPVKTGLENGVTSGVLRLCASARHVAFVYGDGTGRDARYRALLADVARTLDKAGLVAANLEALG